LIADVLKPLREAGFDGWQIALWFSGALSQLEDRRPIDMLDEAPDRVVAAARSVGEVPY
jgi:hypothetical protein